ncbi:hypothetical protein AWI43_28720 [Streptomyces sp. WAC04657]|nr:hypothetical protein AWI43_28720 [Streptomyces sp. WAC04657]
MLLLLRGFGRPPGSGGGLDGDAGRVAEPVGAGVEVAENEQTGGGGGPVLVEEGQVAPGRVVGDVAGLGGDRCGGAAGVQLARQVGAPLRTVEVLQVQGEREQLGEAAGGGAVVRE